MTQIDFYVGAEDRLRTLSALASKALAKGLRVFVLTSDAASTERASRALWSYPAVGFLPHCRSGDRLAPVTPIILDHVTEPLHHEQLLVNLRDETPPLFSRFDRLVEIVGPNEEQRVLARTRFRFYRERGYEIRTHDLAAPAGGG